MTITRDQLLESGARNLREFGYADVKAADILGSYLLRSFFKRMIEETIEQMPHLQVAHDLLAEIETLDAADKQAEGKQ